MNYKKLVLRKIKPLDDLINGYFYQKRILFNQKNYLSEVNNLMYVKNHLFLHAVFNF